MLVAAGIDRTEIQLAGVGFGRGDHVLDRLVRRAGLGDDDDAVGGGGRDRDEVALEIIRQRLGQRLGRRQSAADHRQRVAVVRRRHDRLEADDPGGAGAVVDDELLAELGGKPLRDHPHGHVGDAAGAVGHDDADRTVRIGLGGSGTGERYGRYERNGGAGRNGDALPGEIRNFHSQSLHDLPFARRSSWMRASSIFCAPRGISTDAAAISFY
jgi:hypothetical protein